MFQVCCSIVTSLLNHPVSLVFVISFSTGAQNIWLNGEKLCNAIFRMIFSRLRVRLLS